MRESVRHHAWIILIAVLVFFVNLGGPKLWDRDEPRNAGCAVEMIERGDWITPMFNGELRTHKPVLLYWFMMTAYATFGVGEFAARFWSAVCGLGTVLATYHIGRRLFSATTGLWASVVLSSCMMFPVASRAATPDSVLIFFTTLAMLIFVYGAFPNPNASASESLTMPASYFPHSWKTAAAMYAMMGVAMLAKGPVGLVLPTAIIGLFLLIVRLPAPVKSLSEDPFVSWLGRTLRPFSPRHFLSVFWSMRPITALAASLIIALPWYVWVGVRTGGEWPKGFFLVHHLQRVMEPMESHDGPIFYYLLAILASFFPWSLLLIPTLERATEAIRKRLEDRAQYVFIACWAALYVVAFSFAQTKLPSYVSPALPAFALLTACFIVNWLKQGDAASGYWLRFASSGLIITGVGVVIGLAVAAYYFFGNDYWLGAVGLIPLTGGILGHRFLQLSQRRRAITTFAVSAVLFACATFSFVSVRVSSHQHITNLLHALPERSESRRLATFGCFESSWTFYAGQPIHEISGDDADEASAFFRGDGERFLITTEKRWRKLQTSLAADTVVLAEAPYFMRPDQLLLIGRKK